MQTDIIKLLEENNISYRLSGKNIGRGSIAGINCPFCGDDEGYHLGILKGKNDYYYTCWKNKKHQGTFEYLLSKLIGISITEAKSLIYEPHLVETSQLLKQLKELDMPKQIVVKRLGGIKDLLFPQEFYNIKNENIYSIFYNYLKKRGFDDIDTLVKKYNLKCALTGDWRYRVIFPYFMDEKLVTWTGRVIVDDKDIFRYRDLEIDKSVRHVKFCLYNWDTIKKGGKVLFITEGQFDALKLDFYSGYNATCLSTTSIRPEQVVLLNEISDNYEKIYIILDKGAEVQSMNLLKELSFIRNISELKLPDGVKDDPGSMTKEQIRKWVWGFAS